MKRIKMELKSQCEDCENLDLELIKTADLGNNPKYNYIVICKYKEICDSCERYLKTHEAVE